MRSFLSLIFFFFLSIQLWAQNISVASFSPQEDDLTANTAGTIVEDQNGEKCALIKVETTQTGFTFDVGSLGVTKTEPHPEQAEVWVYVPAGVKQISIAHPQLGRLNNYDMGVSLQKARTYRLILTTGQVETIVHEAKVKTGWLIIDSQPSGASVYLNDEYVGVTPLENYKPAYGSYTYRLELNNYHNASGKVDLNQPSIEINETMKPAFGSVEISCSENGAQVLLDGKNTGMVTPCELEEIASGKHRLTIKKDRFAPRQLEVEVKDGETAHVSAVLEARFARVTINTLEGAQIIIDGTQKGTTTFTEDMNEGYYEVEVRMAHHRLVNKQIHVEAGNPQTLTLEPRPIYGSLDVMSTPRRASVSIDGEMVGQTPTTIENLLEGEHTVVFSLEGYGSETRQVVIQEGQTSTVNVSFQNGNVLAQSNGNQAAVVQSKKPDQKDTSAKAKSRPKWSLHAGAGITKNSFLEHNQFGKPEQNFCLGYSARVQVRLSFNRAFAMELGAGYNIHKDEFKGIQPTDMVANKEDWDPTESWLMKFEFNSLQTQLDLLFNPLFSGKNEKFMPYIYAGYGFMKSFGKSSDASAAQELFPEWGLKPSFVLGSHWGIFADLNMSYHSDRIYGYGGNIKSILCNFHLGLSYYF